MITPYNAHLSPNALISRAFGPPLRTADLLTHFLGALVLRSGFGVYDDDSTFNPIDAPECIPSGCVASNGLLTFIERDDHA